MAPQHPNTQKNILMTFFKLFASSLLWKEDRLEWFQYFSEIISNLQLVGIIRLGLSFCLWNHNQEIVSSLLQKIYQLFSMVDVHQFFSGMISVTAVLGIISMYFIVNICLFGTMCHKLLKKRKISLRIYNCLTYFAQIHHSLIFWILNIFMMSNLKNYWVSNHSSSSNILELSWIIILIILNYLFGGWSSIFCYDPFFSKNTFASYNSTFQTLSFFYKAIIAPILIFFSDKEITKWIFLVLSLIIAFWRQEIIFIQLPYYKYSTLNLMGIMAGSGFAISLTTLVAVILSEYETIMRIDIVYVELITIFFVLKIARGRMERMIYKYSSLSEKNITNPKDIFKRMIAVNILFQKVKFSPDSDSNKVCSQQLLFLAGKMSVHPNNCLDEICMCKFICEKNNNLNEQKSLFEMNKWTNQLRVNAVIKILERGIISLRKNNKFKIIMAYILLKEQEKFSAALLTLFSVNVSLQSFEEEVLNFYLTQKLEDEIDLFFQSSDVASKTKKNLNMKKIVDFEKKSNQLFTLIKKNTQTYLHLWHSFLNSGVPLYEFFTWSIKAEKEADEIQYVWDTHFAQQKHLSLCICLYVTYITAVRNLPTKGEKIISHHYVLQKSEQENMVGRIKLDGSGDVIFYVSVARETLGKTLHVSRSVCREFGWNQSDLINQNIKILMPPFIKDKHDQILFQHIEKPKNQPDQSILTSYVTKKEGYTIPVNIYVTIFPYINNEPIYAGLVQQKRINEDFLVLSLDGTIEAYSEGMARDYNFYGNKMKLDEICLEFDSVLKNFQELLPIRNLETSSEDIQEISQIILTFQSCTQKQNKKTLYKVRLEKIFVSESCYFCLYLTKIKIDDQEKSSFFQEEFQKHPNKKIEFLTQSNILIPSLNTQPTPKTKHYQSIKSQNIGFTDFSDGERKNIIEKTESFKKTETSGRNIQENKDTLIINNAELRNSTYKLKGRGYFGQQIDPAKQNSSIFSQEMNDFSEQLEQAIYSVPKEKYQSILNYLIFTFAILCAGLICFYVIDNYTEFTTMLERVELTMACHRVAFTLVNINGNVRLMTLINKQYISNEMYYSGWNNDFKQALMEDLNILNQNAHEIMEKINSLEKTTQIAIYSKRISMERRDKIQDNEMVNGIQVLKELTNSVNTIAHLRNDEVNEKQLDVQILLKNTLNDPLLLIERIIESIIADSKEELSDTKTKILMIAPLVLFGGVYVLALLLIYAKLYMKQRDNFIEILFKLDQSILKNHLNVVTRLNHSLQSDVFHFEIYNEIKLNLGRSTKVRYSKQKFTKSRNGLNKQIIKNVVLTIIGVLGFASAFGVLSLKFNSNLEDFLQKIDFMTKINKLHTYFNLYNVALVEYMTQNATTEINRKPIGESLEELSNTALALPQQLEQLLTTNFDSRMNLPLDFLITGDVCQVWFENESQLSNCKNITSILGANSLLTMTTYLISSYGESRRLYDFSNHTIEAAIGILNSKNKVFSQQINSLFTERMNFLKNALVENIKESVTKYGGQFITIAIIYGCLYFVIGLLLSFKVWRKMLEERRSWRKLIRQIPLSVVSTNKSLKTFIVNNCDNRLDFLNNMV